MATFRAIAAVGQAMVGLIEEEYAAFFPHGELGASFRLVQGKDFQDSVPVVATGHGVSVYLYRVGLNRTGGTPCRASGRMALGCQPRWRWIFFLITAWWDSLAGNPIQNGAQEQQWLLALALRALEARPTLSAGLLNHFANDRVFREEESIDLIGEVLPLGDLVAIWEVNKPRMQPSGTYLARGVMIDMDSEDFAGEPVQLRQFELAQLERSS